MKWSEYIEQIIEILKEIGGVEKVEPKENITKRRYEFFFEIEDIYCCMCITEKCFEDNKVDIIFNKIKDVVSNKIFKDENYTIILADLDLKQERFSG